MTPQIVAALIHPPAVADCFEPTKFSSAEDKAKFANELLDFMATGFERRKFTKRLYARLSSCFFHIAHFNVHGFAETWFSGARERVAFVENMLNHAPAGSPAFTFSDVEAWLQMRVSGSGLYQAMKTALAAEREASERAQYERLHAKFSNRPAPAPEPRLPSPPPLQTDVAVLRKRLARQEESKALQPTLF